MKTFSLADCVYGGANHLKPPIIVVHGKGGVGKTTAAVGLPQCAFIPVEDGLGMLATNPNLAVMPKPDNANEVMAMLDVFLNEDHQFQWLVIDSITELEKKVWKQIASDHNVNSVEDLGYGKGFTKALEWGYTFINKLRQIRDQRGLGIVVIAHTVVQTVAEPDKDPYDAYIINLHKKLGDYLLTQSDIVGFAALETFVKTEEEGFSKRGTLRETGNRVLHCYSSSKFSAKNRYGITGPLPLDLNNLLNAVINNPQSQQIQTAQAANQ